MSYETRLSKITIEIDVQEAYENMSEKDRIEFLAENLQGANFADVLDEIQFGNLMAYISKRYGRSSIEEFIETFMDKKTGKRKSMKPFDLEACIRFDTIVTRSGNEASLFQYDEKEAEFPLVVLITRDNGDQMEETFTKDGMYFSDGRLSPNDLFMANE